MIQCKADLSIDVQIPQEKYRFIRRKLGKLGPDNVIEQALNKFARFGYTLDSFSIYNDTVYMALVRNTTPDEQRAAADKAVLAHFRQRLAEADQAEPKCEQAAVTDE